MRPRRNPRLAVAVKLRDQYVCQDCGRAARGPAEVEAHHVIPLPVGPDTAENMITLCVGCHLKRHGRGQPPAAVAAWRKRIADLQEAIQSKSPDQD